MLVKTDEDNQPTAMLCWKPLRFATPQGDLPGAYVFGVATLPRHRGNGFSTMLIGGLHSLLAQEGMALSCLVPASLPLFDFYARQGFGKLFCYKKIIVGPDSIPVEAGGALSPARLPELEEMRNMAYRGSSLFGKWDVGYLAYADDECRFRGGEVLRFECRGKSGYAVCYPQPEGAILVKEAAFAPEDIGALLFALHSRYSASQYELRVAADYQIKEYPSEVLPFAMVKWYDEDKKNLVGGGAPWFAFGLD